LFRFLVESVRNKILSFALEIEGENPDAGEAAINSEPIPDDKVTYIFNNNISGQVQNLAIWSTDITQEAEQNLYNDIEYLTQVLKNHDVSEEDISELKEAIEQDKKETSEQDKIGSRVSSWRTNMLSKAASGAWNVSIEVASTVLSKALCSYYGLS